MADVKVVVVDDSAAMRALFCDILDQAKGVQVVGVARNADDARDVIEETKPDVLTLDVEMPGMTGMEFLEELMSTKPMPVIMLSSITQAGTGTAEKALQLGAVHCFPKPLHTSPEEFSATVQKLGDVVIKAANGELSGGEESGGSAYQSDGRIVALACGKDGFETMREVLAAYPSNCPPTLIVLDADKASVDKAVDTMRPSVACTIRDAHNGAVLEEGVVYLAYNANYHAVVDNPEAPQIAMIERDPVGGNRPSADLMFGSIARAKVPVIGGVLFGAGQDGAKGLQMLSAVGATSFVLQPVEYVARERYDAVVALGVDTETITKQAAPDWILDQSNTASGTESAQDLAA